MMSVRRPRRRGPAPAAHPETGTPMTAAAAPTVDRPQTADHEPRTPGAAGPGAPAPESAAERRRQINRQNAARSTGPRTAAGRAKSAMNAYKHGLYARATVVPGGETRAFRGWLAE